MDNILLIVLPLVAIVIGTFIGYIYRRSVAEAKVGRAEDSVKKLVADAQKKAEAIKKETVLEAKEEIHIRRSEFEKESKDRRNEIQRIERRLAQREEMLDKKVNSIESKEEQITRRLKEISKSKEDIEATVKQQIEQLEKISSMTSDEAKELLLEKVEQETRGELAVYVREIEAKAKDEADRKSREIISSAIQKYAADHVAENTVSVVSLPSDEMKGRIIGREGRNIRALETATGIDLIIDDTPEAVSLSGFDPIRREIARLSLEKLVQDGRIHPARIEELVEKTKQEFDKKLIEEGKTAAFDVGIHNLHPELIKLLGKLRYRTSFGQNALQHSKEVSIIMGILASELELDSRIAKRAGLLHDIGKAIDHQVEGTHAQIGADLLRRYGENELVINSAEAHHEEVEFKSIFSLLALVADAISASRPGARRETLETYIKRLRQLETTANSFDGVDKSFAIQAGREIRVIVQPGKVKDDEISLLAHEIKNKLEQELDYPGNIKITVIRETRAVDYAK